LLAHSKADILQNNLKAPFHFTQRRIRVDKCDGFGIGEGLEIAYEPLVYNLFGDVSQVRLGVYSYFSLHILCLNYRLAIV